MLCSAITEYSGDDQFIWKTFNKILQRCPRMQLPDHSSLDTPAETFGSCFINTISVIWSSFLSGSVLSTTNSLDTRTKSHYFTSATEDEEHRLVLIAPCKSSDLNHDPYNLSIKICINILAMTNFHTNSTVHISSCWAKTSYHGLSLKFISLWSQPTVSSCSPDLYPLLHSYYSAPIFLHLLYSNDSQLYILCSE